MHIVAFFPTDMGVPLYRAFVKPLCKASKAPTESGFMKTPYMGGFENPIGALYTHMHISVFFLQIWGCLTIGA